MKFNIKRAVIATAASLSTLFCSAQQDLMVSQQVFSRTENFLFYADLFKHSFLPIRFTSALSQPVFCRRPAFRQNCPAHVPLRAEK